MSKVNVMVFPAGEINSVELHDALSHNVNINVFGSSSIERHGKYIYKNYRGGLPNISDIEFIDKFNELLTEWSIDFVFPTHDTVALFFSQNQEKIKAKVIVASYDTALVCRDKKKTYMLFSDCDFCPYQYEKLGLFPVFIKPREGQGGKGSQLIKDFSDVPDNINLDDYVISEYLPGEEMTVDCLTDISGKLCVCLPRIRQRTMAGVCVSGKSVEVSENIKNIALAINERLIFLGLWYFQIKRDCAGKWKLLEISTRCAGTMCLSRARGINLPLLSVYAAMGKDISIFENPYTVEMDRTLISRYIINYEYDTVYIDYDDTIIEQEKVCLPVIRFIYQCKNDGKSIVLLTRHEEDYQDTIQENLCKHFLSEKLFDEIICLTSQQRKSDFVKNQKSIFIDNAYVERKEIHDILGIPVFDVEGVEVLADWRD